VKILEVETLELVLSVHAAGIDDAYAKARKVNGAVIDAATGYHVVGQTCDIRVYKPKSGDGDLKDIDPGSDLHPLFYENKRYGFEILFKQEVLDFRVYSRLKSVTDEFHKSTLVNQMFGSINFGNDIGKSDLVIRYLKDNVDRELVLTFEVFPVKLSYRRDFKVIVRDVDRRYSFLTLHFFKRTYSTFQLIAGDTNNLIWWQIFEGIYKDFIAACKYILTRPHMHLTDSVSYVRLDQIKRLSPDDEERLVENKNKSNYYHRSEKKVLSVDTPENQFLKYVVFHSVETYRKLKQLVVQQFKVSEEFREELNDVETTLISISRHAFFKKVSEFKGLRQESLVLQRASGYSTVFRCWIMLQQGLGFWDGRQKIELKNIADLYQIWCFLEMESILEELLGQEPDSVQLAPVEVNGFLLQLAKDQRSRITFKRDNGDVIDLYHEYKVPVNRDDEVVSYTLIQKPDIVLRITKSDLKDMYTFTYLYDAKYQLLSDADDGALDSPPKDAINQMHRYRDAIYFQNKDTNRPEKEVIGGYVLFPGRGSVDDFRKSPFQISIQQVNIGAFPLAPGDPDGKHLIREHLMLILNVKSEVILKDVRPQKQLTYEDPNPYVLIGVVSKPEQVQYFSGSPSLYHTGKDKPNRFEYQDLKYFCPYITGKGISEYYEINGYKLVSRNEIFPEGHALHNNEDSSERLVLYFGKKHIITHEKNIPFKIQVYRYTNLASLKRLARLTAMKS